MSTTLEQHDFQIESLDLPTPTTATIFGVRVLLNVPSQVFPFLRSNLSTDSSPYSIAALTEWLPHQYVPTTYMNILSQSIIFLQNNHECHQYVDDSIIFLTNAFPDLDIQYILDALESFGSDLYETSLYLNQENTHVSSSPDSDLIEILNPYAAYQISHLLAFDSQYQKNVHPQPSSKVIQENDDDSLALAIFLHMEEEDYEQSEIRKRIQKEDEDYARTLQEHLEEEERNEKKRREEEEKMMDCCCCFTSVPFNEMVQCPKGHLFCRNCVKMSIETALSEGRVRTECLCTDGCNSKISMNELERVLPANLIKRLNETESFNAISEANIPGLRTCWRCGYKIIDEDEKGPFVCPKCEEKTCKKCCKKYHQGRTCEEADLDPNRIIEKKMSEAIVRQCPKCHTQFIKDEGCNHMTCPRCHTEFCYLCGKIITGHVDEHYKNCTQFMDNNKYNNEQIQNARRNAIKKLGMHS